jgi:hypothetical protein
MSSSAKLVTLNNRTLDETVPSTALAEKLYPDNVRRKLLENDSETKLFHDYEEYHDAEPTAKECRLTGNHLGAENGTGPQDLQQYHQGALHRRRHLMRVAEAPGRNAIQDVRDGVGVRQGHT